MARWYGAALTTGATVEQVASWPKRVSLVTADEVREAARSWLDKTRSVTGYLVKELPAPEKRS
jgi:zinc protease